MASHHDLKPVRPSGGSTASQTLASAIRSRNLGKRTVHRARQAADRMRCALCLFRRQYHRGRGDRSPAPGQRRRAARGDVRERDFHARKRKPFVPSPQQMVADASPIVVFRATTWTAKPTYSWRRSPAAKSRRPSLRHGRPSRQCGFRRTRTCRPKRFLSSLWNGIASRQSGSPGPGAEHGLPPEGGTMKTVSLDWSDTEGVSFLLRTKGLWPFEVEEITMALEKAGYTPTASITSSGPSSRVQTAGIASPTSSRRSAMVSIMEVSLLRKHSPPRPSRSWRMPSPTPAYPVTTSPRTCRPSWRRSLAAKAWIEAVLAARPENPLGLHLRVVYPAPAAEIARTQSRREHLAVHARKLALKPRLQILRGHSRPLLSRMANTAGPTLEDHVHRSQAMGPWVLINEGWYKPHLGARSAGRDFHDLLQALWL